MHFKTYLTLRLVVNAYDFERALYSTEFNHVTRSFLHVVMVTVNKNCL